MNNFKKILITICALLIGAIGVPSEAAQKYPDREVRIVVPYTPGGFNDTFARTISHYLTTDWKESVVVENRPGGNTIIGNSFVARAAPDGYTLLVTPLPFSSLPGLYGKKLPYDALKNFDPVVWAASTQNVLVVRSDSKIKTVKDLVDYAKKNPKKVNYGSTGTGSSNHLSMELFMSMTGTQMTHIPYKGSSPAVVALLSGDIDVFFDNMPNVLPQIRAGKFRAIATTGLKRSPLLPDVPTVAESGVPGYEVNVWFGLQAPAGTPANVIAKLNKDVVQVLRTPAVVKQFGDLGVEVVASTPEQFDQLLSSEIKKWGDVVKAAHIQLE
ncbi:tripartite tricarboxylate transporter substrate binding protein [Paralcaligenes sp. KSB-10]|jgi:tripartite-type tricarboxylate transporter receptor subunit TctC|uniref:Bug family tripartite tricarboxylate transporter substrate binding protein n=1 Tax=Paralcaligenes sp. KSB-10 TaxID=2901142 RepID=UPI001E5AF2B5|nr:tripartite tricarboxylate transporter substrate binding protein [Paralcaligenes sp. KSB-10]UHL63742.1 tripartite tricarboxylate transporter substrate binding protein [Paralcaligenes sp. KSB-10]